MNSIGMKIYKNPYINQYVAPYRYCFFSSDGQKLGRIIWANNVEGIYLDECDDEGGL